ncbi:hypothetical protein [Nocardia mangyaensis]|nr:hypothetical protein [Nocardia mangyaensis]
MTTDRATPIPSPDPDALTAWAAARPAAHGIAVPAGGAAEVADSEAK